MSSGTSNAEKLKSGRDQVAYWTAELTAASTAITAATNPSDKAVAFRRFNRAQEAKRQAQALVNSLS